MNVITTLSEGVVVRVAETETSAVVNTSFLGSDMALEVGFEIALGFFYEGLGFLSPNRSGTRFLKHHNHMFDGLERLCPFR